MEDLQEAKTLLAKRKEALRRLIRNANRRGRLAVGVPLSPEILDAQARVLVAERMLEIALLDKASAEEAEYERWRTKFLEEE